MSTMDTSTVEDKAERPMRKCSFCDRSENNVSCLVVGPFVFICDICTQITADIVLKHLWDKATRLQDTIKGMEKHGGIPSIEGVSDQDIPKTEAAGD